MNYELNNTGNGENASADLRDDNVLKMVVAELMESSSESEDDLEEILVMIDQNSNYEEIIIVEMLSEFIKQKRNSLTNYLEEVVPKYTDKEFRQHFRISRDLFENLSSTFEESHHFQNVRNDNRITANVHLAVFLWFAGHEGCSFRDISALFNLPVSTISRIIEKTCMFISSLSPDVIKWPNEDKKKESAYFFKNKYGFSMAIGSVGVTRIVIDTPAKCKDECIDRQGNVSIFMQAVCDENKKFINVFIGFPGTCHNSSVLLNSPLYKKMPNICEGYYILGDSAYRCTQYILTPYKDNGHLTRAQKNFNCKLSEARAELEHSFRMLKQRFKQLYYCKLKGIDKLCHFIRACCVLHNIANETDLDFLTEENNDNVLCNENQRESSKGIAIRDLICRELN